MAVKFFGQFLVENNLVSREALLSAIELQEQKNLKLGEMAISLGYATAIDIERAHNAQLSRDMRLGDLLVEMGILTISQLNDIVTRQQNTHLYIGEALVRVGALNNEQLQKHLEAFKQDQSKFICDRIELPAGISNGLVWEMIADLTYKMITRVLGLPFRPGKCQTVATVETNFMLAAMDLSGDIEARYMISVSERIQHEIAKAILREESVAAESMEVLERHRDGIHQCSLRQRSRQGIPDEQGHEHPSAAGYLSPGRRAAGPAGTHGALLPDSCRRRGSDGVDPVHQALTNPQHATKKTACPTYIAAGCFRYGLTFPAVVQTGKHLIPIPDQG